MRISNKNRTVRIWLYLPSGNVVDPSRQSSAFQDKWVLLQKIDVGFDAFFKLQEREKVNIIYCPGNGLVSWSLQFDFIPKVFIGEGKHSTARVVKNGNFVSAK